MKTHATRLMLVLVGLIGGLGCAEGTYEELDGGAMEARGAGTNTGVAPGMPMACQTATDCPFGWQCDPVTRACTQPQQGQGGAIQPGRSDGGMPQANGMCATHAECGQGNLCGVDRVCRPAEPFMDGMVVMSACSDPNNSQRISVADACLEQCESDKTQADDACRNTPARLADCLVEAEETYQMCRTQCGGIDIAFRQCGMYCVNEPDPRPCVAACLGQGYQLSIDCLGCYGEFFGCSFLSCGALCAQGEQVQMCIQCRANSCDAAFQACAGLAPPF